MGTTHARRLKALDRYHRLASQWPTAESHQVLRYTGVVAVIEHEVDGEMPPLLHPPRCRRIAGDRLCVLTPAGNRLNWPIGEFGGKGPVTGWSWDKSPAPQVELTCGSARVEESSRVWAALTGLQGRQGLVVLTETPCREGAASAPPGGRALRLPLE